MLGNEIAERYAQALFDLAIEEDEINEIESQFKEISLLIENNDNLNLLLKHPKLSNNQKKEVLKEIFEEELSIHLMSFIKLLVDKNRINYLNLIYKRFKKLVDVKEDRLEVQVFSPIELAKKYQKKLKVKLEKITRKEVILSTLIQPDLLGGLKLKIGDKIIDGSLVNHLKKLELQLKSLEVSKLGVKIDES